MESNSTIELSRAEYGDRATIEYAPAVMEDLRRISVDGFIAFGHGGLEIGGILYGVRDGDRLSILACAKLQCEHALGPGFVLSAKDREALERLLIPPAGLETVGWFRSHTRSGLPLDGSDQERFERYFGRERSAGLVLKPTHWGTAEAAFFVREIAGGIFPLEPRSFTIEPPKRKQQESLPPERPAAETQRAEVPAPAEPTPASEVIEIIPPVVRSGRRWFKLACALALVGAALALYSWPRASNNLGLQAYAAAPGQIRIEWNHNSLPVLNGTSGNLQIRDGDTERTIPLDRDQLQVSSLVYLQTNSRITVRMHVDPSQPGKAPTEEAIEVVGSPAPSSTQTAELPQPQPPQVQPQIEERSRMVVDVGVPAPKAQKPTSEPSPLAARKFQASFPQREAPAPREAILPVAPVAPTGMNVDLTLPDILKTAPMPAKPAPQGYTGPRSGRLIWTGDLDRRGVIEIERDRSSIGALSGSLCSIAAAYRVAPAEFTRDGLMIYTSEGSANGRREPPSKSNGWNSVQFVYDPARASELVVLEQPSQVNNFGRLVLRNNLRTYHVVVIDWIARADSTRP